MPVYKFSAQLLVFRIMAVRDIELRSRLSKNTYLSRDF